MIVFSLAIHSCRNDYFPDQQENPNDRNALRYTYKRISLDESKHKTNLIPELKKVNEKFKTLETYVSGKAVKYSNGVSVNTDDVIYIERGPDVHSYTFHLTRDNAAEDAPLENLVLSLLPDGTYKELLITYHFTLPEKQILANGGSVDTKGKLTVEELNPGTYNGGLVGKSDISCEWVEESYYTSCSEGQHFNGELPKTQGGPCKADQPSTRVTVVVHRCKALPATTGLGDDGTGGGGGPFGGSGGNNNGTPTIPNLPLPGIPTCKKTKSSITNANTLLHNNTLQQKMDNVLKGKINAVNEWSVAIGQSSSNADYEVTEPVEQNTTSGTIPNQQLINPYIGDGHSHAGGLGTPSGGDLYGMLSSLVNNSDLKYRFVYGVSHEGTPEIYALVVYDLSLAQIFLNNYPKSDNYDPEGHGIKEDSPLGLEFHKAKKYYSSGTFDDTSGENYDSKAVAMAYILDKYNVGMSIAKVDLNGDLKRINATIEQIIVPYSGGNTKEGIKVSKCP